MLEHCRVRQSIELESVPTILHLPKGYNDRLICGMTDGRVVLFRVGNFVSNFTEETLVEANENSSAVTAIDAFDLTGDGKIELIVGRRNGSIQVYSLPSEENAFDLSVRQIYDEVNYEKNGFFSFKVSDSVSELNFCNFRTSMRVYRAFWVELLMQMVILRLLYARTRVEYLA